MHENTTSGVGLKNLSARFFTTCLLLCMVVTEAQVTAAQDIEIPVVSILDTLRFESSILKLRAWGSSFGVLEENGTFSTYDSAGQQGYRTQFDDIEVMDDFEFLPYSNALALIRNREVDVLASDWQIIKLRIGTLLGNRSSTQIVDLEEATRFPVYEFDGNVVASDFDLREGIGVLLVFHKGDYKLDVFDIRSGKTVDRIAVTPRTYNVVIDSSGLFVLERTRVIEYRISTESTLEKLSAHPTPVPTCEDWSFISRTNGYKTVVFLNDSCDAYYGPVHLRSGGSIYPQMEDFWGNFLGEPGRYSHYLLPATKEIFVSAGDEFAIGKLDSDEFQTYVVSSVFGYRHWVRIIPLTARKCVVQLFDQAHKNNMLVLVDFRR